MGKVKDSGLPIRIHPQMPSSADTFLRARHPSNGEGFHSSLLSQLPLQTSHSLSKEAWIEQKRTFQRI